MNHGITRRAWGGAMLAAAAAAAQTPPGAAPSTPANPNDELQAARDQNRRGSEALAKVPLPMDTEPAFHFTA
jgi:hypothetical protein